MRPGRADRFGVRIPGFSSFNGDKARTSICRPVHSRTKCLLFTGSITPKKNDISIKKIKNKKYHSFLIPLESFKLPSRLFVCLFVCVRLWNVTSLLQALSQVPQKAAVRSSKVLTWRINITLYIYIYICCMLYTSFF